MNDIQEDVQDAEDLTRNDGVVTLLSKMLVQAVSDCAAELEDKRKLADRMGGLLTISQRATVAKGVLAGHVVEVSIAIDPEADD